MRDGGKGDKQRPLTVPKEQFENNWDAIFGKKKHVRPCQPLCKPSICDCIDKEYEKSSGVYDLNKEKS
jgi:hypothetical protein